MAYDHADFMIIARAHAVGDDKAPYAEAHFRTAISRAYYAAFGVARKYVRKAAPNYLPGTGRDHGRLVDYFKHGSPQEYPIYAALSRLREDRNESDYDLDAIKAKKAQDCLLAAEQIINDIRAL